MRTPAELNAFAYGMFLGFVLWFVTLAAISWLADIRWQPVKVGRSDAELATKPYPDYACSNYPVSGITLPACPKL